MFQPTHTHELPTERVRLGATRMTYREPVQVLGPVRYEPSMVRVRLADGSAVRVFTEHLRPIISRLVSLERTTDMATDETYNGWTNRETWAVALHINNDQGWQESVHEALRTERDAYREGLDLGTCPESGCDGVHALPDQDAGEIIRDNVEEVLSPEFADSTHGSWGPVTEAQWGAIQDIGSLWRVNWDELGASFLSDLDS